MAGMGSIFIRVSPHRPSLSVSVWWVGGEKCFSPVRLVAQSLRIVLGVDRRSGSVCRPEHRIDHYTDNPADHRNARGDGRFDYDEHIRIVCDSRPGYNSAATHDSGDHDNTDAHNAHFQHNDRHDSRRITVQLISNL